MIGILQKGVCFANGGGVREKFKFVSAPFPGPTGFAATVANIVFAPSAPPPLADACIPARFSPVGALVSFRILPAQALTTCK